MRRDVNMDQLLRALDNSGDLRSRLMTTARIGPDHAGRSVNLVGILGDVRLLEHPEGWICEQSFPRIG